MIISKKLNTKKINDNEYEVTIIEVNKLNKNQTQALFKANRDEIENAKKAIADIEDYLKGNETIEGEVCGT